MNNDDFQTLETEMIEVKKTVSDGKTLVAAAVTRKDVQTAATDSFATIASNIDSITTVEQATADTTAIASDILINKTAYAQGLKVVGTMPNIGAPATAIANGVLKEGYTHGGTIANLIASNVRQGVNIAGILGTLEVKKIITDTKLVPYDSNYYLEQYGNTETARFSKNIITNIGFDPKMAISLGYYNANSIRFVFYIEKSLLASFSSLFTNYDLLLVGVFSMNSTPSGTYPFSGKAINPWGHVGDDLVLPAAMNSTSGQQYTTFIFG